jgi:hypothetical protein
MALTLLFILDSSICQPVPRIVTVVALGCSGWNARFCGEFLKAMSRFTLKLYWLDKLVITHASAANTRHVKNADNRLRSPADNFTIAMLKKLKAFKQKAKSLKHKAFFELIAKVAF